MGLWGHRQRLPALEVYMRSPTRRSAKVPLSPRPVSINRQGPRTGLPAAPASWTRRTSRLVSPLRSRAEPWPRGLRSAALEGLSPLPPRPSWCCTLAWPAGTLGQHQLHPRVPRGRAHSLLQARRLGSAPPRQRPASAAPQLLRLLRVALSSSALSCAELSPTASAHRLGRSSSPLPHCPRSHRLRPSSCA